MRIFIEDDRYFDRVTHATGYAEVHRGLILALDRLGVPTQFPPCSREIRASPILSENVKARLLAVNERAVADDEDTVHLQVATPDSFVRHPGRFDVGLTMTERESLEYYQKSFDWVGLCNQMDMVLTPTDWNRAVFERHGIRNVVVAPLGVDADRFRPRPYGFLSVATGYGRRGSRSNWADIVDAYRAEFDGHDDVVLTFLTPDPRRPFEYSGLRDSLALLPSDLLAALRGLSSKAGPRIEVTEAGHLSQDEVVAIYRRHDCFISYSREGWGLPILEAMACSLDVVSSDYGAPMTFLAGSPARLFRAGRLSADNLKFEGGDIDGLRGQLRACYGERRRSRAWAEGWTWDVAARSIVDILNTSHAAWKAGS